MEQENKKKKKKKKKDNSHLYHLALFLAFVAALLGYLGLIWWCLGAIFAVLLVLFFRRNTAEDYTYVAPDISKMDPREVFEQLKRNASQEARDRAVSNVPVNYITESEPVLIEDYSQLIREAAQDLEVSYRPQKSTPPPTSDAPSNDPSGATTDDEAR